ncbi:MAG: hypothetical protein VYD85_08555 [Pseudomonadota bacterium]|nr:hypothetical protein [Pseudomonadota bacterium]
MIYTVELNFSDASKTDEWNAWYETYLKQLVSLDGLETAQRFRAVAGSEPTWEYLALYTVPNLDVYESEAYRKIGGGGNASKAFHHAISRRRNVYKGVERMPAVSDEARVLFWKGTPDYFGLPDCLPVALTAGAGNQQAGATKIDGIPERRAIAVADAAAVERYDFTAIEGFAVYAPITQRHG